MLINSVFKSVFKSMKAMYENKTSVPSYRPSGKTYKVINTIHRQCDTIILLIVNKEKSTLRCVIPTLTLFLNSSVPLDCRLRGGQSTDSQSSSRTSQILPLLGNDKEWVLIDSGATGATA